ncbi:MAG: NAD-dependent epimerase/dehydratase family protein [Phycisphaerales bacterium]
MNTHLYRPERALVTGGAGFIGSHLCTSLLSCGAQVRVLDDLSSGHRRNLAEGAEFLEGSVLDEQAVREAVAGCQLVVHLAAEVSVPRTWEDPERAFRINLEGAERVFRIAGESGVRSVAFASSAAVYGPTPALPSKEAQPFDCASPYAAHKAAGELLLQSYSRRYGFHAASLRFFNVFGPRQDPKSAYAAVISAFMAAAAEGRRPLVFGDGSQTRDFVPVADVVEAIRLAADPARELRGDVFNVGLGERRSLLDLLRVLSQVSGRDLDPQFQPPRAGDVPHSCASIERVTRVLGYAPPVSFEDGLAATWRWASAAG